MRRDCRPLSSPMMSGAPSLHLLPRGLDRSGARLLLGSLLSPPTCGGRDRGCFGDPESGDKLNLEQSDLWGLESLAAMNSANIYWLCAGTARGTGERERPNETKKPLDKRVPRAEKGERVGTGTDFTYRRSWWPRGPRRGDRRGSGWPLGSL